MAPEGDRWTLRDRLREEFGSEYSLGTSVDSSGQRFSIAINNICPVSRFDYVVIRTSSILRYSPDRIISGNEQDPT